MDILFHKVHKLHVAIKSHVFIRWISGKITHPEFYTLKILEI